MSLRGRLVAGGVVVAVVLAVAAAFTIRTTRAELIEGVDARLVDAARVVRTFDLRRQPTRPDGEAPQRLSDLYLGLLTADGELRTLFTPNVSAQTGAALGEVGYVPAGPPSVDPTALRRALDEPDLRLGPVSRRSPRDTPGAPEAAPPGAAGAPAAFLTVDAVSGGGRYRVLAVDRGGPVAILAQPLESVDQTVARLRGVDLLATAVVLAVLALVGWWVIRLGVRPLKHMTAAAGAIAAGDLSRRVPEADPRTEAGELGTALNRMLTRIEEAFRERAAADERLRRFVADASHELRTPITTIRGYADLYRAGGLAHADELDDAMRRTGEEAARMGGLVDDLLHLARLDQGRPLRREPVDVAALVRDAAADARAHDPERPVSVTVADGAEQVVVVGDEARLRQVLANVVTNAVLHTPPATPVRLSLTVEPAAAHVGSGPASAAGATAGVGGPAGKAGAGRPAAGTGHAVVAVADDGPGMDTDAAARAFERFYRADPSRSRHHGGSGLGLAIVQATVEAHGGDVSLESSPEAGTTVRIRLPLSAASPAG